MCTTFAFARRLHREQSIDAGQLLFMELYPFHSARVTRSITPSAKLLDRFVFEPLAEIDSEYIFAFGMPWRSVAPRLGLGEGKLLAVTWKTVSREARVYTLASSQKLIVMTQLGYAGPPGSEDTEQLRRSLGIM